MHVHKQQRNFIDGTTKSSPEAAYKSSFTLHYQGLIPPTTQHGEIHHFFPF